MALTENEINAIKDQVEQEHRAQIINQAKDDFNKGIENPPGKSLNERIILGVMTLGVGAVQDRRTTEDRLIYQETQEILKKSQKD